jgi:excinuclease ABC subunit A
VIRNADWVIDLGPEGGEDGGRIVGEGRPAKIAATPGSYTGQFLKRYYKFSNGRLAPAESEAEISAAPETAPNGSKGPSSSGADPSPAAAKANKMRRPKRTLP